MDQDSRHDLKATVVFGCAPPITTSYEMPAKLPWILNRQETKTTNKGETPEIFREVCSINKPMHQKTRKKTKNEHLAIHQLHLLKAEELFSSVKVLCPGPCDAGTFRRWVLHEVTADLPAPWISKGERGPTRSDFPKKIWFTWCFGHMKATM